MSTAAERAHLRILESGLKPRTHEQTYTGRKSERHKLPPGSRTKPYRRNKTPRI